MTKFRRLVIIPYFAACALIIDGVSPSQAQNKVVMQNAVRDIADELKKGNNAQATKAAAATAKKIDDISDLMRMFRPVNRGGMGITAGFEMAAIGEIALAIPVGKDREARKAWKAHAVSLRNLSVAFAGDNGAQKDMLKKQIDMVCAKCHETFKR